MLQGVRSFFADPARQALGWAALGIAGVGLAAGGLFLMTRNPELPRPESFSTSTPPPTRTATAIATPPVSASPSQTAEPTVVATQSTGNGVALTQTAELATLERATPTPPPVASAGVPYSNAVSQSGLREPRRRCHHTRL